MTNKNITELRQIIENYDANIFEEHILEIMTRDEFPTDIWYTIIRQIFESCKLEPLLFLIENIKIDLHDDRYSNIFLQICARSYLNNTKSSKILIETLIKNGLDINKIINKGSYTNLLYAYCCYGNYKIVKLLIENGADINISDMPVLAAAVDSQNEHIVKLLIDIGADVNIKNGRILVEAVHIGNVNIMKLLLAAGANLESYGKKMLESAIRKGHTDIVKLLIDEGVDINSNNCLSLALAIKYRRENIVYLLLQNGINVDIFNSKKMFDSSEYSAEEQKDAKSSNKMLTTLYENGIDSSFVADLLWSEMK